MSRKILGPLGSSGMGEAYRARDSVLKREVAIKVLPPFVSQDPDTPRRFRQDAEAAAALNHPNVLTIHRLGTFEGSPYRVSQLTRGDTLRQISSVGRCQYAREWRRTNSLTSSLLFVGVPDGI